MYSFTRFWMVFSIIVYISIYSYDKLIANIHSLKSVILLCYKPVKVLG